MSSVQTFLRVKFCIWPGRGGPIETGFKQEVVQALKAIDPQYADWMVAINYEVVNGGAKLVQRAMDEAPLSLLPLGRLSA